MSKEVLCKDCKYAKERSIINRVIHGYMFARCERPKPMPEGEPEFDRVTGKLIKRKVKHVFCSSEREAYAEEYCGHEGKFWVPKSKEYLFTYIKRLP